MLGRRLPRAASVSGSTRILASARCSSRAIVSRAAVSLEQERSDDNHHDGHEEGEELEHEHSSHI